VNTGQIYKSRKSNAHYLLLSKHADGTCYILACENGFGSITGGVQSNVQWYEGDKLRFDDPDVITENYKALEEVKRVMLLAQQATVAPAATDASGGKMELLAECKEILPHIEREARSPMSGPWWKERRDKMKQAIARAESSQGQDEGGDAGKGESE
jgi:hypothetical protein